jgi:hypothetical protein
MRKLQGTANPTTTTADWNIASSPRAPQADHSAFDLATFLVPKDEFEQGHIGRAVAYCRLGASMSGLASLSLLSLQE